MKKQFITRVFLSSLVLALTSLFGGGNLLAQTEVFYESFDECAGVGGNDGTWGGINQSATLTTTNKGWTFENENGASKCARFGSKSNKGSATTPELNFEGAATLTFKAGAWKGDKTTLKISILNGGSFILNDESLSKDTTVTMKNESWSDYEIAITGATTSTQIKFEGYQKSAARFFLDEVKITRASSGDPTDKRNDPELDYGVSEYNATIGQTEGFPTLSNPHGVTDITYSSSDKTVATVDEKSGKVTLKDIVGTTTITASISGSQTWKDDEASYTLNVSKRSANLTYKPSSCTVIVGETPELPTLSNPEGVEGIVYESSNTAVATVNATTGEVTLTGSVGTTTITASLTGDATYADGSASYELTVKKPNVFVYKKVTSAEDLVDGGVYIMVCDELKSTISAIESSKGTPTDVTISGDIVEAITGNVVEFTLEDKDTYYRFKNDELYLYGKYKTDIGLKALGADGDQKWKITIDAKVTKISCLKDDIKTRQIGVNTTINPNKFGLYSDYNTSSYPGINLYRKVYPLTVSSATGGYATFYNEEEAYQMPEGLTGYAVTKAESEYITRKTAYEAGDTVPAKTPLLIIGAAADYYPAVVSGTGVEAYAGNNLLEGKRDANGNTQSAKENVYYYKLGLNTKGVPGFYWGDDKGAAFKMTKATTAYLAVPKTKANGANALFFDFGPETGINEIQTEQANKAIFDLSGRRVKKATKGFYIVGGKKVLVK